jgi:hypothetical protein
VAQEETCGEPAELRRLRDGEELDCVLRLKLEMTVSLPGYDEVESILAELAAPRQAPAGRGSSRRATAACVSTPRGATTSPPSFGIAQPVLKL